MVAYIPGIQNQEIQLLPTPNLIHSRRTDAAPANDIAVNGCWWLNNTRTAKMDRPLPSTAPFPTLTSHTVDYCRRIVFTEQGGKKTKREAVE